MIFRNNQKKILIIYYGLVNEFHNNREKEPVLIFYGLVKYPVTKTEKMINY
jgi:hypothetical protein